jgi:TetR/AcrR family transcriptional repressor of mexJK operon
MRQHEKQDQIIQAALNRFSHFGLHKTTISEIAEDVGMTKQALHYYFADKQTLIAAVIEYISNGYLHSLGKQLALAKDFEEVLVQLVEARYSYFNRYFMVIAELRSAESLKSPQLVVLREYLRKQEHKILNSYFEDALQQNQVRVENAFQIIELVQDILDALFQSTHTAFTFPGQEQVEQMIQKQKQVIHLLYRGIAA